MTSSKKAKKPSTSFKKASKFTMNPGVPLRDEENSVPTTAGAKEFEGQRLGDKVKNLDQQWQQQENDTAYVDRPIGATNVLTGQSTASSPRNAGQAINEQMKDAGESTAQAASRLEGNAKIGAEKAAERLTGESKDRVRGAQKKAQQKQTDEAVLTPEKARAVSDNITEKQDAEQQAQADEEKRKKDDAEIAQRIQAGKKKAFQDGVAFGPEDEERIKREYRQEQAQSQIDEMREEERRRIRDDKFNEMVAEKQKNGEEFDSSELMAQADEYATNELNKVDADAQKEHEIKHDPAAAKARSEMLVKNLDRLGDTLNVVGAAGEYANKGLDIMKGVLNAMLNPSPLGLNEAQTVLSTTAEAFNLANDLVGTLVKKGEEHVGKKVMAKMAESMGNVINAHFNGKDMSQMTPEELNEFTDRLTMAWQPFMDRLETIGSKNPVGARIVKQFQETFGQINKQAKSNREEIRLDKKRMEQDIRDRKRDVEQLKFKTTQDVIDYTKNYHKDLLDQNSGRFDPQAALGLELLNEQQGHDASGLPYELTHDQNGNSIIDDNYYAVLLDKKNYRYNAHTRKFEPTPQAARIIATRIAGMKANNDPDYLADQDKYDALFNEMNAQTVRTNEYMNDARAEEKHRQHLEGARTPIERVKGAKTLSDRNYIRKQIDNGDTLAEIFPRKLRKDIGDAARSDVIAYESILRNRGYLTQSERNAYNIAKNTQDLVRYIDDTENLQAQISIFRDKKGDEDWINPLTGKPKWNPQTNRYFKNSEVFNYNEIDKQINDVERLAREGILGMALSYDDADSSGNVHRTHILEVSSGKSDSLRKRLLAIQSIFPGLNIIKDPEGPYRDRIGMGDITAAVYWASEQNENNMAEFANVVVDKFDELDNEIRRFDANSDLRAANLAGMLGIISGRVSGLSKIISAKSGTLSSADMKPIIDAIDRVDKTVGTGLSQLSKKVGKVDEDLGRKLDSMRSIGRQALKALKNGDPNAAELVKRFEQMNEAILVKLDDDSIDRLSGASPGGTPSPPPTGGEGRREMPSWYDRNKNAGPGEQWYTHMNKPVGGGGLGVSDPHNPKEWPVDQYWNIQNDLLALIENTRDEGAKAALRNTAQKAFRYGMFGDIAMDPVTGRYYVNIPQGGMKPKVNLEVKNDGKVYPKGGKDPYSYMGPDGKPVVLTVDNYNMFMKNLHDMSINDTAARLDAQNNLDLSKDATSAAGGEKYMKALIKLFAPMIVQI